MAKDRESYRKGVDTARRIVDIMEGKEDDCAALEEELNGAEYKSLIAKLSDANEIRRGLDEFRRPEARREALRFRRQVSRRAVFRRIAAISAAAAVTAVMAGTWYITGKHDGPAAGVVARASDDNITLTLPDGALVVLDKLADDGLVATLRNVTLSMEDGALVSEVQPASGYAAGRADMGTSTINVPRGNMFDIHLADGTKVWVNANSKLRFPVEFPQAERRVWLEGEAYFEVSPDAERPFIVETREQTLNVLGTKFNIYAYPGEQAVFTTLVEGSVSVRANHTDAETGLKPGQQARLSAEGYSISDVDAAGIASWRERMFVFDDNTLGMVFDKLSRWYDFEYVFEDPQTAGTVMMGTVPVDYDFETVLRLVNAAKVANIELNGNVVTIRSK